jgi:GGDEF domain-containing protein
MHMDPATGLPGRSELVERLSAMLADDVSPALFAVAIHGYAELAESHTAEADAAMREVTARLGRLVRASDVLAVLSPGVFALAGPGVGHTDTAILIERVQGAFALPVQVGPEAVSFPVTAGIAHPSVGIDGDSLVAEAEADLHRRLEQR